MGGSATIQGIKAQTLICLLEALNAENNWKSLILEPNFGNSKVDIEWYYEDGISLAQIKSSQKGFTINQVKKLALEIEHLNPDCDSIVLTLVANNFGELRDNQQISGKTTVKLFALSFDDLRAVCSNKLDVYLHRRGIPTPPGKRDVFVSTLIDRLEDGAIKSRVVTKDEFTKWLHVLLEIDDSNFLDRESLRVEKYRKLLGVTETDPVRRNAVLSYYQKSRLRNLHRVIRHANEFLEYDEKGNLTVEIGLLRYSVYTIFLIMEAALFLLGIFLGLVDLSLPPSKSSALVRAVVVILFIMTIPLIAVTNPFIQALRIRYDLSKRIV